MLTRSPGPLGTMALLLVPLLARPVQADPSADDRALATALFEQGRSLMSEGRTAEACPKLEESHRLDPSGGTILNLALCHEQQGLLARSWSEYHEAIAFAGRDGRSDREQAALLHVHGLEARLSKLTIVVPDKVRVDGLRIERDGRELGEASWSTAMPVDGGEHVVRATAPGKVPFSVTVVIGAESDARTIEVPAFASALVSPPAPPMRSVSAVVPQLAGAPPRSGVDHPAGPTRRPWMAWTIGAAGLVQWGAAGYFGLQAFRKHADSNSACPNNECTSSGVELNTESARAADISTILTITGLATLATSVYLLWTSREAFDLEAARVPPRYSIGGTGSTIGLSGRF